MLAIHILSPEFETVVRPLFSEAEVIALANASRRCLGVIDEKRGRRIASGVYGLPVEGTAGLFVEAHRRGLLDDLRETLLGLKRDGYFRLCYVWCG